MYLIVSIFAFDTCTQFVFHFYFDHLTNVGNVDLSIGRIGYLLLLTSFGAKKHAIEVVATMRKREGFLLSQKS